MQPTSSSWEIAPLVKAFHLSVDEVERVNYCHLLLIHKQVKKLVPKPQRSSKPQLPQSGKLNWSLVVGGIDKRNQRLGYLTQKKSSFKIKPSRQDPSGWLSLLRDAIAEQGLAPCQSQPLKCRRVCAFTDYFEIGICFLGHQSSRMYGRPRLPKRTQGQESTD